MRLPRYTEGANGLRYNPKCVVASDIVVGVATGSSPPPTAGSRSPSPSPWPRTPGAGLAHYGRLCTTATSGCKASAAPCPLSRARAFKPALDADNRYTGGAATRASKPAGGYSDAQLTPWARNGECG